MTTAEVTRLPGNDGNILFIPIFKLKARLLENTYRIFQDPEGTRVRLHLPASAQDRTTLQSTPERVPT